MNSTGAQMYKKHAKLPRAVEAALARSRPISMATAGLRAASEATIADYAARAEAYALGSLDHDVSQNIDALLRPLKDRPAPLDILDLCCAGGRDLVAFKKLGHRPIGLDGVSAFCEMAAARSGCEVWQQDLQQLDLPAERFDGICQRLPLPRAIRHAACHPTRAARRSQARRRTLRVERARVRRGQRRLDGGADAHHAQLCRVAVRGHLGLHLPRCWPGAPGALLPPAWQAARAAALSGHCLAPR